jgi:hypothetical protein
MWRFSDGIYVKHPGLFKLQLHLMELITSMIYCVQLYSEVLGSISRLPLSCPTRWRAFTADRRLSTLDSQGARPPSSSCQLFRSWECSDMIGPSLSLSLNDLGGAIRQAVVESESGSEWSSLQPRLLSLCTCAS